MKYFTYIFTFFFLISAVNCNDGAGSSKIDLIADSQLELGIEGMVCEYGCAKFIEKQVSKMTGVSKCEVNFSAGIAKISFSSQELNDNDIIETIEGINDGQYKVTKHESETKTPGTTGVKRKTDKPSYDHVNAAFRFPELITYFMLKLIR